MSQAILLINRRDETMIALLSGVVVVLIVCHTPKAVINIYESYQVSARFVWRSCSLNTGHILNPNLNFR